MTNTSSALIAPIVWKQHTTLPLRSCVACVLDLYVSQGTHHAQLKFHNTDYAEVYNEPATPLFAPRETEVSEHIL